MFGGYALALGKPVSGPPGVTAIAGGGVATVQNYEQPPRYVVQFFIEARNLTNHPNYVGYSGVLTSPFFGRATTVTGTRKIDAGINFAF
jgi:murein DD-endopeptidase MepM/ murein hydrolase activator NlpD